jgi:hypothetical protein
MVTGPQVATEAQIPRFVSRFAVHVVTVGRPISTYAAHTNSPCAQTHYFTDSHFERTAYVLRQHYVEYLHGARLTIDDVVRATQVDCVCGRVLHVHAVRARTA